MNRAMVHTLAQAITDVQCAPYQVTRVVTIDLVW